MIRTTLALLLALPAIVALLLGLRRLGQWLLYRAVNIQSKSYFQGLRKTRWTPGGTEWKRR